MNILAFLRHDLWRLRADTLPFYTRFCVNSLRVLLTTFRRFMDDRCSLIASGLTFYSLLSIVPLMACFFGVAKGFGFEEKLKEQITQAFAEHQSVLAYAMQFSENLLEHTQGELIAGIGLVFLLWTVIQLLSSIESAFNLIWRVERMRSWSRVFSDYLALVIVLPLFFVLSASLTVITTHLLPVWPFTLLPYFSVWILFTLMYLFIPNTSVGPLRALVGGVVAGSCYQLVQWGFILLQIGVAHYGAIYGSFSALPLFFIWVQISWIIVLFGGQLVAALRNVADYEFRVEPEEVSHQMSVKIAILVMHAHVQAMKKGEEPLGTEMLTERLKIPLRLALRLHERLVLCGLLVELAKKGAIQTYRPAYALEKITGQMVVDRLESFGEEQIYIRPSPAWKAIQAGKGLGRLDNL